MSSDTLVPERTVPRSRPVPLTEQTSCLIGMRDLEAEDPLVLREALVRRAQTYGLNYNGLPADVRAFLYHGFMAGVEYQRLMGNMAAQLAADRLRNSP